MTESSDRDDRGRFAPGESTRLCSKPRQHQPRRQTAAPIYHFGSASQAQRRTERRSSIRWERSSMLWFSLLFARLSADRSSISERSGLASTARKAKARLPSWGPNPSTVDEHREAAISLYRSIIIDPSATPRDKLAAQEGLNRILGLVEDQSETALKKPPHRSDSSSTRRM